MVEKKQLEFFLKNAPNIWYNGIIRLQFKKSVLCPQTIGICPTTLMNQKKHAGSSIFFHKMLTSIGEALTSIGTFYLLALPKKGGGAELRNVTDMADISV